MKQATLEHFKQLFTSILNDSLMEDLSLDEALHSLPTGDLVDQALGDRDQHLALKLKGRQGFFLKKVTIALEKIENGSFGHCEECDGDISTGRLLARPTATLCISCKEEQEFGEKHIPYQKRSHTHGLGLSTQSDKVISLNFTDNSGDNKKGHVAQQSLNV
ncbi:MAG: TraR/DksA family transcriptional regulator [Bacteriovoracaceae bacterium]|nr:TraR/DksA family transcriptional regulator [Bacteriovoracaceae bacterium]